MHLFILSMFCVEYAKSVRYTDLQRPVIEEDIVKAIKFKLNNEERAFRKQHEEQQKSTKDYSPNCEHQCMTSLVLINSIKASLHCHSFCDQSIL